MIEKLRGKLYSTVVGSFPYKVNRELMSKQEWRGVEEIRKTAHRALEFQLECGIEFPSDGQFFDMVEMYVRPLMKTGFITEDRTFGGGDLPGVHPSTSLEAELEALAKRRGAVGLRIPITGPFTLGYRVKSNGKSVVEAGDSNGIMKLAEAVETYSKGFDHALRSSILSVDEPVLPFVLPVFGEDFVRDVLNGVFSVIERNYSCMHVCGGVSGIRNLALSLEVEILDHEFQGTDNSGLYSKRALEENGKLLSYGVINTNPRQIGEGGRALVETQEQLRRIISDACNTYGRNNLLISPDCGFGGWRRAHFGKDIWGYIREKLSNMVRARDTYLEEA